MRKLSSRMLAAGILVAALLGGCGQKGPLYHPPTGTEAAPAANKRQP